jgi:hypothetical protein
VFSKWGIISSAEIQDGVLGNVSVQKVTQKPGFW